jgi:hypothetical protein
MGTLYFRVLPFPMTRVGQDVRTRFDNQLICRYTGICCIGLVDCGMDSSGLFERVRAVLLN